MLTKSKQSCKSKVIWTLNVNKSGAYIPLPKSDLFVYGFQVLDLSFTDGTFSPARIVHVNCSQLCESLSTGSGYHVSSINNVFCVSPIIANIYFNSFGTLKYSCLHQPVFKFDPINLHYVVFSFEDEFGKTIEFNETNQVKISIELYVYI